MCLPMAMESGPGRKPAAGALSSPRRWETPQPRRKRGQVTESSEDRASGAPVRAQSGLPWPSPNSRLPSFSGACRRTDHAGLTWRSTLLLEEGEDTFNYTLGKMSLMSFDIKNKLQTPYVWEAGPRPPPALGTLYPQSQDSGLGLSAPCSNLRSRTNPGTWLLGKAAASGAGAQQQRRPRLPESVPS